MDTNYWCDFNTVGCWFHFNYPKNRNIMSTQRQTRHCSVIFGPKQRTVITLLALIDLHKHWCDPTSSNQEKKVQMFRIGSRTIKMAKQKHIKKNSSPIWLTHTQLPKLVQRNSNQKHDAMHDNNKQLHCICERSIGGKTKWFIITAPQATTKWIESIFVMS